MARGRKFRSVRRYPESERSLFEQKLAGRYSRTLDRTDLLSLIRGGEDTHLEFKIRLVNIEKVVAEIVAIANSGGGAIIFGVNDQRRLEGLDDPEQVEEQLIDICRNRIQPPILPRIDKVSFDNGVRIVVLQVDDRRAPHSTPERRFFLRIGSTKREAAADEIAALFANSRAANFEDMPVVEAGIEDVDEALVWSYIRDLDGDAFREPQGFPTAAAMRDIKLATVYGSDTAPTLAGFLLFGRNRSVGHLLPNSKIILTRFSGTDTGSPTIERIESAGNLLRLFDQSLLFVKRYVDLWESRPPRSALRTGNGDPVQPRANYPRDSVLESLVNMLVHRDYFMTGPASQIQIFDDRLEFVNANRENGSPKKSIEYGVIKRTNPRLHHILTSTEYGLPRAHRGVPSLRRAHYVFAKREPRISLSGDEFRIELFGI